jgi:hypothetical protein
MALVNLKAFFLLFSFSVLVTTFMIQLDTFVY